MKVPAVNIIINGKAVLLLCIASAFACRKVNGQTTVTYPQQTANYYATYVNGAAGVFDQGTFQLGMYANSSGAKQAVAWRKFRTDASGVSSCNRSLQAGDQFVVTISATRAFGRIGFALLASPSATSGYTDRENNYAVSFNLDGPLYLGGTTYGNWYAKYAAGATSVGSAPVSGQQGAYKNFTFTLTLTAPDRMNASWTDGVTTSNLYDIPLNTSNPITDYSIYLEDDWDGTANRNVYWGHGASNTQHTVTNNGVLNIGQSGNSFSIATSITNGVDAAITSVSSTNTLNKTGSGTLTLQGSNTYAGNTIISGGVLSVGADNNFGTVPATPVAGSISYTATSSLQCTSSFTLNANRGISLPSSAITARIIVDPAASLSYAGTITGNSSPTLVKQGTGTLVLSGNNTFSSPMSLQAGITRFMNTAAAGTTAGGLSVSNNATLELQNNISVGAEALTLNGAGAGSVGALRNISGNNSWAGVITFQTNPVRINSDAGTLSIGNNISNGALGLTVGGNGNTTISGVIGNGAGGLNKDGNGTLTLGAANTYTGNTTISAGILQLAITNAIPSVSNLLLAGGTFSTGTTNGYSNIAGTLTLTGNATISLGTGSHIVSFTNSSAISWTGSSLIINGWAGTAGNPGTAGRIFVGSNASGLTATQLAKISFTGFGLATLLSTGELVPTGVPPPSINSILATPNDGNTANAYVGSLITISGSGFTGITQLKYGGSSGTVIPVFTIADDNTITFTVSSTSVTGAVYVQSGGGNATSSNLLANAGYITATSGNWQTASTWLGGIVPPVSNSTDITLAHDITGTTASVTMRKLTINTGVTFVNSTGNMVDINGVSANNGIINNSGTMSVTGCTYTNSGTLTITNGGKFQLNQGGFINGNALVYDAVASTLTFNHSSGPFIVSDVQAYWPSVNGPATVTLAGIGGVQLQTGASRWITNLNLSAGFDIQSQNLLTVSGTLTINAGGFIQTNAPVYGNASTLNYNSGGNYTTGTEWSAGISNGAGVPYNVSITSAGTAVNFGTSASYRSLRGSLAISAGTFTLSAVGGGDLRIGGDLVKMAGTFNTNGRAVIFEGSNGPQNITGISSFDDIEITNTSNVNPHVIINNNIGLNSGATLRLTSGYLVLGNYHFTMPASGNIMGGNTNSFVVTDGTGSFSWSYVASGSSLTRLYPLGNCVPSLVYAPITLNNIVTLSAGSIAFRTVNSADPNINNSIAAGSFTNRYYVPAITVSSFTIGSIEFRYAGLSEITGSESLLNLSAWNATVADWQNFGRNNASTTGLVKSNSAITNNTLQTGYNISARAVTQLYFRSTGVTNDWAASSSWETSTGSSFTVVTPAGTSPNYLNALGTTIRAGHVVNSASAIYISQLQVDGTLNMNGSSVFNLIRTSGTDLQITAAGRMNLNSTSVGSCNIAASTVTSISGYLYVAGNTTSTNFNGSFTFNNGSTFENASNGGTIPIANWLTGSTVLLTGNITAVPGNLNQVFHHFTWNVAQTANVNFALSSNMTINGNFTVLNTSSAFPAIHELRMYSGSSGNGTLTINGKLVVSAGVLTMVNNAVSTAIVNNIVVTVNGLTELSGTGKLIFAGANAVSGAGTIIFNANGGVNISSANGLVINAAAASPEPVSFNIGGDLNVTSGNITSTSVSVPVTFNKISGYQYVALTASAINANALSFNIGTGSTMNIVKLNSPFAMHTVATMNLLSSATLDCGLFAVTGGSFVNNAASILQMGSAYGITIAGNASGNIQTTTRTYHAGANYVYNGNSNQSTGNGLPLTITGSVTINHSGTAGNNTVALTNNGTETKSIIISSGYFAAGAGNTLKISNNGSMNVAGGDIMPGITGGNIWLLGNNTVTAYATGKPSFYDLTIGSGIPSSPVSLASNPTVNHYCTLNKEAAFSGISAPFYANGSTLIYNSGGNYNRSVEWGGAAGNAGYPWHVLVQNATNLHLGLGGIPANLETGGDLAIGSSASGSNSVYMDDLAIPLRISGNLVIGDNATTGNSLTLSTTVGGDLELGGNFTRHTANNYFNDGMRSVKLNGMANSFIHATAQNFYSLIIDKSSPSNTVTLQCPTQIDVNGAVQLSSGILQTSATNLFTINAINPNALSGGSSNSYINGPVMRATSPGARGAYLFPVGKQAGNGYRPVILNTVDTVIDANTYSLGSTFTVEYFAAPPPDVVSPNYDFFGSSLVGIQDHEYWQVDRSTGSSAAKLVITYSDPGNHWRDANGNTIAPCANCNVAVVKRSQDAGNTGIWDFTPGPIPVHFYSDPSDPVNPPEACYYTDVNRLLSTAVVTSFSPFTFGFSYNVILPVQLVSFTGRLYGSSAKLNWQISHSENLGGFELQYSKDGRDFDKLAFIAPQKEESYDYLHRQPVQGLHFYRLKLLEKNGKSILSNIVALATGDTGTRIIGLQTNPVTNSVTPIVFSASAQDAKARLHDASGRLVLEQTTRLSPGTNNWQVNTNRLSTGVYFITVTTADHEQVTLKFVKQ